MDQLMLYKGPLNIFYQFLAGLLVQDTPVENILIKVKTTNEKLV